MIIRSEKPSDIEAITEVIKVAFEDHSFSEQTEHFIICDLRTAGALSISLVAEVHGRVVGHIAFSPVTISDGTTNWYGLGPVSVLPEYQGGRIGTAMIDKGITSLKSMGGKGCVIIGLPAYFNRFGFKNYRKLVHEGIPQEVFAAKSFAAWVPNGKVEYHEAFKKLSAIEKDAIADVIIDYCIEGIKLDSGNPVIESLIKKEVIAETIDGKFVMRLSALAKYDSYLGQIAQFRVAEMGRVHKNPILAAIHHGTDA
ncbi:MAG: hypothetical protein CSA23_06900 [Deltaproteobacteria bacterium]|nr:MAG: hypothetical protein CSA23_06900 [Deltaproteobacteria bacterium]